MGTRRKEEKRKEEEGEEEGHPSQGSVQKEKGKGITLCEGDAKLFEHVLIAHVILPLNGGCEIIGKWKIVFKDKRCVWIGLEVAKNSVISAERRKALVHSFLLVLVVMIK